MNFIARSAVGMSGAYLVLSTTYFSQYPDVFVASGAGLVTALVWDVCDRIAERIGRNDRMVKELSKGQCPNCKAMMSMEVTSEERHTDQNGFSHHETDITCKKCDADFVIFSSEGGPIVKRLKRC